MNISDFSSFFTTGWGLFCGIAFAIFMLVWHASGINSKINDHEKRLTTVENSTNHINASVTDIKVAIARIEALLSTLLKLKQDD